jgi:voltage-dependent potassium channel beta subunit
MQYRRLGDTGIKISVLSLGNWQVSYNDEVEKTQIEMFKRALDAGINFFDTAEGYGLGAAETILGKALKTHNVVRSDIVLTTKVYWSKSDKFPNVNDKGLSRKHIFEGITKSLQRLQVDYVDVVYCHRPDDEVSLEETCKAMSDVIEKGFALYWGTSEWPACYISAAIEICKTKGWHAPVAEQCEYSMLMRDKIEADYAPIFEQYKYGSTIWSPLASGFLSGKYNNKVYEEGTRLNSERGPTIIKRFHKKHGDALYDKLKGLHDFAAEIGCTQSQLALLWVIQSKDVSTCILGARNMEQLEENLSILSLMDKWKPEYEERVNKILDNVPELEMNFRTWEHRESRRQMQITRKE